MNAPLPAWDGDVAALRQLQAQLAAQVRLVDDGPVPLRRVAGVDVGFEDAGAVTRAAIVVLDASTRGVVEQHVVRLPTRMPYIPGFLSFRELPALLQALDCLPQAPDLVLVDGHGVAHPRGLGIAAHLGVATGLPTVGVAKKVLVGRFDEPGPLPGDRAPLLHHGRPIGTVLRSKVRCRPLIVSPGHRMTHEGAVACVLDFLAGYRLPEPTRLADRLASRRDEPRG